MSAKKIQKKLKITLIKSPIGYRKKARLTIDNITIYPVDDQFFFDIIKSSDIMFDVNITVEYYQGFYWHHHLENISMTVIKQDFSNGGEFSIVFTDNFEDQGTFLLIKDTFI